MLVMLYTWQAGDCSAQEPYNGNFKASMQGISAKTLVLPGKTDLYFPCVDDCHSIHVAMADCQTDQKTLNMR